MHTDLQALRARVFPQELEVWQATRIERLEETCLKAYGMLVSAPITPHVQEALALLREFA